MKKKSRLPPSSSNVANFFAHRQWFKCQCFNSKHSYACRTVLLLFLTWKQNFFFSACFTTGGSCKKSPDKINWIPPKGISFFLTARATASSLSKKLESTIEISSMIKCLQRLHCWARPGRSASSIHCVRGALPLPIPEQDKKIWLFYPKITIYKSTLMQIFLYHIWYIFFLHSSTFHRHKTSESTHQNHIF